MSFDPAPPSSADPLVLLVNQSRDPMAVFHDDGRLLGWSRSWQAEWSDRLVWPSPPGDAWPSELVRLELPDGRLLVIGPPASDVPPHNRFLSLIESLPFAVGVHRDLRFVYVNRRACDYLGYASPDELVGHPIVSIVPAHELDSVRQRVGYMMRTGMALPERVTQLLCADGRIVTAELSAFAIEDFDGLPSYVVVARDVTERLVYEERLQQVQRMEAVGRLAGGIAHDFNNVLSIILSYADMLCDELPPAGSAAESAREIRDAARRAAEMTRRLLTISRGQPDTLNRNEPVRVGAVIEGLQSMLKRLVGREVKLVITTLDEELRVAVGTSQLEQIILNLVINARDAMPSGGTIAIDVRADTEPVPLASDGAAFVRIRVVDDGHGMSDVVRDRAFEPFFTTKGPGLGTGLGLSTVFGIAKQAGGAASIDSAPDAGTRVDVWLPATPHIETPPTEPPDTRPEQPPAPSVSSIPAATRVLVVEDDHALRVMVTRILAHAGFAVDEAEHAEAVIATYLEAPDATRPWPTLVVTDVVMGECSGPELATALRQRRPGLPVLFMSGFTEELLEPHHTEGGPTRFIPKPFTPHGLVDAVRALIRDADGDADDTLRPLAEHPGPA